MSLHGRESFVGFPFVVLEKGVVGLRLLFGLVFVFVLKYRLHFMDDQSLLKGKKLEFEELCALDVVQVGERGAVRILRLLSP